MQGHIHKRVRTTHKALADAVDAGVVARNVADPSTPEPGSPNDAPGGLPFDERLTLSEYEAPHGLEGRLPKPFEK